MTISVTLPLMVDPVLVIWFETITAMYGGTAAGGPELLPGSVVHMAPQPGTAWLFSKPLNAFGAGPPLSALSFAHCAPQKFTVVPGTCGVRSPMTKAPPAGNAKGSQASPTPLPSMSPCDGFGVNGQLSCVSGTPSLSSSASHASPNPSPSLSA